MTIPAAPIRTGLMTTPQFRLAEAESQASRAQQQRATGHLSEARRPVLQGLGAGAVTGGAGGDFSHGTSIAGF